MLNRIKGACGVLAKGAPTIIKGWLGIAAIYFVKWGVDFAIRHYERKEIKEQKKLLRAAGKVE